MSDKEEGARKSGERRKRVEPGDVAEVARLVRQLRRCGPELACRAATSLGSLGRAVDRREGVLRALMNALRHHDPQVRKAASSAIWKLGRRRGARGTVITTLAGFVRADENAARLLARFGDAALGHPDLQWLFDYWSTVHHRRSIEAALAFCGALGRGVREERGLLRLIKGWRTAAGSAALRVIRLHPALMAHPEAIETIRHWLRHDRYMAEEAVQTIVEASQAENESTLLVILDALHHTITAYCCDHDGTFSVDLRHKLLNVLSQQAVRAAASDAFLRGLVTGLKGESGEYRHWCARVLEDVGRRTIEQHAVAIIVADGLLNWDPNVREVASSLLQGYRERVDRSPDVLQMLASARDHGADDIRGVADLVLRELVAMDQPSSPLSPSCSSSSSSMNPNETIARS